MKFWAVRIASILAAFAAALGVQLLAQSARDSYVERLVVLAGLYVTLAVSLNLINGITGQFSIGHAAFYQVGAYVAGYITLSQVKNASMIGLPWLLLMCLIGMAAAAIAGLVVGLPSLRLRGDYLAIVTLGFGEIIRIIVQNTQAVGGAYGMNVPKPMFPFIWLVWLLAFGCIATCRNLLKTAHGLPFLAVREDEVASSAMGVNVTRVKVVAFIIGSAFAGAAGGLLAHYEGFITPQTFRMDVSFIILTMVVLGGTGSITGSALAAVFLSYLPEWLRGLKGANGAALTVSGGGVLAALLVTAVAVGLIKLLIDRSWRDRRARAFANLGIILGAILLQPVLTRLLNEIGPLGAKQIEAGQLRMVIFAVSLIAIMLLRPQGVFAHHEFSWSWLRGLFGGKVTRTEISA